LILRNKEGLDLLITRLKKNISIFSRAITNIVSPNMTYEHESEITTEWALQLFSHIYNKINNLSVEHVMAIFINSKNKSVVSKKLFSGNKESVFVDLEVLMKMIIDANADKLYLAHNHPCGLPYPSKLDKESTELINNKCKEFGIEFCDHIILSKNYYYSFSEKKLL